MSTLLGGLKQTLNNFLADSFQSTKNSLRVNSINAQNIVATDISFTAGATVTSGSSAFGNITDGAKIRIAGSPLNSGEFRVNSATSSALTLRPSMVQTESSGATINITVIG